LGNFIPETFFHLFGPFNYTHTSQPSKTALWTCWLWTWVWRTQMRSESRRSGEPSAQRQSGSYLDCVM